jgi:hypothetical protein
MAEDLIVLELDIEPVPSADVGFAEGIQFPKTIFSPGRWRSSWISRVVKSTGASGQISFANTRKPVEKQIEPDSAPSETL